MQAINILLQLNLNQRLINQRPINQRSINSRFKVNAYHLVKFHKANTHLKVQLRLNCIMALHLTANYCSKVHIRHTLLCSISMSPRRFSHLLKLNSSITLKKIRRSHFYRGSNLKKLLSQKLHP